MEDVIDLIATGETPSKISDQIKDILYAKSAERINEIRPEIANSMFDSSTEGE